MKIAVIGTGGTTAASALSYMDTLSSGATVTDTESLEKIVPVTEIHDELYALTPGPDPVDIPLIREKKKKLPHKTRKFAGYN